MSRICTQCETINFNDASFCKNCGTKLNKEQNNSTNDNLSESERYFNSALKYADLQDHLSAIRDYTKSIELNPSFRSYYNRGNLFSELKDYQLAIKDYTMSIELNPEFSKAYNNRGNLFSELKDYQLAIKDCTKAIELNPNYVEAYNNRGVTYYCFKDYDSSIKDYTKAIELNSDFAEAYKNRGILYVVAMNNLKSATQDARKACILGDCELLNFMEKQGFIRDLNSTNLSESERYVNSGNLHYNLKDYSSAILYILVFFIIFIFSQLS
jgi:tetratricopeptide (TPR) repeat protein